MVGWEADAMGSLALRPLEPIGLSNFVALRSSPGAGGSGGGVAASAADGLPFDLSGHGDAQSAVAKDLLVRLEADVKAYAAIQRGEAK